MGEASARRGRCCAAQRADHGEDRSDEGIIMKTDSDLKKDVMAELAWDPAVKADAVGVAVKNGIVTLSGHLDTFAEKFAVERALRRVAGVKAIALELDIKLSPQHRRSDTEIAAAAEQALMWRTSAPADKIRLTVEDGWVRMQGEVEWDYQRASAEKAIRPLVGVIGISNEISLKAKPVPADLSLRIEDALKRQALREAKRVEVAIDGSTVTLRGNVHSWQERDAVQGAAWSAPGVRCVINEVRVGV
jgi:osmotically-inducible protein OsmY